MAMVRWEPFKEMEKWFEEEFPIIPMFAAPRMGLDLAVDVFEEKDNVIAEMNLPGVNPEKIEISFHDGLLKITGSREEEKESKEKNFYCKEIKRGVFERLVRLPVEVKTEKADAQYKKGVLRIVMPKKEEIKTEKVRITVH